MNGITSSTDTGLGWLGENIFEALMETLNAWLDLFSGLIDGTFTMTVYVNETKHVGTVVAFTMTLAYILLITATLKQLIDIYGFHTSGDSNESPIEVIYRASVSSMLISVSEFFYSKFFEFSKKLGQDVETATASKAITSLADKIKSIMVIENIIQGVTMTCIILIAIMIFFVIASIRGAQLILFRILFPIFAVDRSFTNKERWSNFLQAYIACFVGFAVQILCFNMFRLSFMDMSTSNIGVLSFSVVPTFGWLLMAIKAPAWLDKYAFKSGVGESISRTVQSAGSILMMRTM